MGKMKVILHVTNDVREIYSFFYSFSHVTNAINYVPGIVVGTEDIALKKTKILLHGSFVGSGKEVAGEAYIKNK